MENGKIDNRPKDPALTGKMYLVENPRDGAHIFAENFFGGMDMELVKGDSIELDETVAKAAAYQWRFLKISPITKKATTSVAKTSKVTEETHQAAYEHNGFDVEDEINVSKYSFMESRKILIGLGTESKIVNKMKKDAILAAIDNLEINAAKTAIKSAGLEVHLV